MFHDDEYETYMLFGSGSGGSLHQWSVWCQLSPALRQIADQCRGRAAVRSVQFDRSLKKYMSFGALKLDTKSDEKWTHGSPVTTAASGHWHFGSTEIWAPSWTVCSREDDAPDFFAHLLATNAVQGYETGLVISTKVTLPENVRVAVGSAVRIAASLMINTSCVYRKSKWGRGSGGGFTDSIQDLPRWAVVKPGEPLHGAKSLRGGWADVDPAMRT